MLFTDIKEVRMFPDENGRVHLCVCVCVCVCVHARVSSVVVCVEKKQNLLLFVLIWVFWFCFGGRCFIYIYRERYIYVGEWGGEAGWKHG